MSMTCFGDLIQKHILQPCLRALFIAVGFTASYFHSSPSCAGWASFEISFTALIWFTHFRGTANAVGPQTFMVGLICFQSKYFHRCCTLAAQHEVSLLCRWYSALPFHESSKNAANWMFPTKNKIRLCSQTLFVYKQTILSFRCSWKNNLGTLELLFFKNCNYA